jgi:integrative and conjugative element protein (TIGR02256 family)
MVRAFLLGKGGLQLGEIIGALFSHNSRYYRERMTGRLGHQPKPAWRDEVLDALDVQMAIGPAAARAQSGITDEGLDSVLVGAGALGSPMLNLWGRSGWGRWTVIDKDRIKPHNLVRHEADARHIGLEKVEVAAALHDDVAQGASQVSAICADAHQYLSDGKGSNVLREAKLVIDASTTLEYPRAASGIDGLGRHMSVFITPDGNGAVLLAEDAERHTRLRTLEAQYYRAVINEPWGQHHLIGNLGTYWSGASCRDISIVLPYSRVLAHASTLSEQVRFAAAQPGSVIRIWTRDPSNGSLLVHDVGVHAEQRFTLDTLSLFIDHGLINKLRALRASAAPAETGGVLLGYYDFNIGAVVLVDSLPAPPDSVSTTSSFERGITGLSDAVKEASRRTADVVGYLGEWHSHPPGHSAKPSQDDLFQLVFLSLGMADEGLGAISLIVGERDIQVLQGRVRA